MIMKKLRLLLIVPIALQLSACEKQEAPMPPADAVVAKRIDITMVDADDIPQIFKSGGMEYNTVSALNWPEKYRIDSTGNALGTCSCSANCCILAT